MVKSARRAIESFLDSSAVAEDVHRGLAGFSQVSGVFVTLRTFPGHELRGCIGYSIPDEPLSKTLVDASLSAAFKDPRFKPLEKSELKHVTVEVAVLTKPELLKVKNPDDYFGRIRIGRDGLVVRRGVFSGLLLPQVPVELGWAPREFLERCCEKAGLDLDEYKKDDTEIYTFQAQTFSEKEPGGAHVSH